MAEKFSKTKGPPHKEIAFEKSFFICVGPSALLFEENAAQGLAAQAGMCRAVGTKGVKIEVNIGKFVMDEGGQNYKAT